MRSFREPRLWPSLLVAAPESLSRRLLSLASGIYDPHLFAKRLQVERWTDQEVGLILKGSAWAGSLGAPVTPISSVTALTELSLRLQWDWQARVRSPLEPMQIEKMDWEFLRPLDGTLKSRYRVEPAYRDQILFDLQRSGHAVCEGVVHFLDESEQMVAHVSFKAQFVGRAALPAPPAL